MIDMKKGDIVKMVEFESVTNPATGATTVKKFEHTRRCIQILKGKANPVTKMMEYEDVSLIDLDMVELANPDIVHRRYAITYDNIAKVEIP